MTNPARRRRLVGWGFEDAGLTDARVREIEGLAAAAFPDADLHREQPRPPAEVELDEPRLDVPAGLAGICRQDREARCRHALGRSYTDAVRAFRGEFAPAPDVVALPRTEREVANVLEWCADARAACVPFGGGTSVVGGVNPPSGDRPVVTLQLRALDRVREVDVTSGAAHIQAGATGPVLERQLAAHGRTLHYLPQSWELSTVGGWLATRSAGHFAMRESHIDHLVEQVTAITPAGRWASLRVPADGAGPAPDALLLGSEGTLGVITDAWLRIGEPVRHRASLRATFATFEQGAEAVRGLAQAGLDAQHLRLLPPFEAGLSGVAEGDRTVLLLGYDSSRHPVDHVAERALEICRDAGGTSPGGVDVRRGEEVDAADDMWARWRRSYLAAPYERDVLVALGVIVETFETAVTWDRVHDLRADVTAATEAGVARVCGAGIVSARISHAYPDGASVYFTVVAPGRRGDEIAQWRELKAVASDAVLAAGGTITHHHGVGRDHRPWYDRQRPEPFARGLRAAKQAVDPRWTLNPGVLVGPDRDAGPPSGR